MNTDNKELIAELRLVGNAESDTLTEASMRDLIWRAADALEAAERDAWLPIETAPKDGSRILLCSDGGAVWMGHWIGMSGVHAINGWTRYNCVDIGWEPNHWSPLPAPPKKED